MPDIQTHQRQVTHNLMAAKFLQEAGETYLDWVATILYYAALHSVDQVLFQNGEINPRNHRQRHASIAQVPELHSVYPLYRELEYQSRRSRYECDSFSSEEIQTLSQYVAEIQKIVEAFVGE